MIHFHMLFLDGVHASDRGRLRFRRLKAPEKAELESLVHTVSERVGRYLERGGLVVRDMVVRNRRNKVSVTSLRYLL